ncbi:MAG TPA: MMPL family transporter [Myxococcota bacterium]|nr:MMPL family transporter [Myxococcota bacterium]HQK50300.1 MMPL family transporter [Myxococcota bacterium]
MMPGSPGSRLGRALDAWMNLCSRYPGRILLGALVFGVLAGWTASGLSLHSDFIELLPTDSPSVRNLERLKTQVASYSTLVVAMECPDLEASKRFADDLSRRLRTWPRDRIWAVDDNIREIREFYSRNRYLYADLEDLVDFRDRLRKRIQEETEAQAFESLDDSPAPRTDLGIEALKAKYDRKVREQDRYPDGYYVTPDRSLLAIFIRPPSGSSSFEANERLVQDVQREIDALDPSSYHPEMRIGMTGDIKTGLEEREALASDARFISILCLVLICGVIVAYYRSLRSLLVIGTPMLLGLLGALAVARMAIGYLNTATAFLASIIAGNGINFMIMLAARFFEESRKGHDRDVGTLLRASVRGTLEGTAVAAAGAAIAYGSLSLAGFRGFRQFGIIGGTGMALCWIATFLVGPALIALLHRMRPLEVTRESRHPISSRVGSVVARHPRWILLAALLLSAGAILAILPWSFDPFEYHFRNLRNRESIERGSAKLSRRVDKIFDLPTSPTPVVLDRAESAPVVKAAILASPDFRSVIGGVKTLQEVLPTRQEEKLAVLAEIRALIDRKIDFLSPEDRAEVERHRPPEDLRVLTLDDIPEMIARPFTEADGTRGRVLYVYSHPSESLLDGRYLLKFARFLRSIQVPGVEFYAVGQPLVFADMIAAVLHDGLRVTLASALAVALLLVVAFRSASAVATILTSVLLGTLWMVGLAALLGQKLNFLNFVVFPITLGIGVDYGVNIFSRYRQEGPGRIREVIQSTGGAVVLTSSTTILGYATLITSTNMALQSFGIIADLGEFACLATSELVMTALLVWRHQGRSSAPIRG